MSKIPLPERGQPLDLSYIYQVAATVNELAEQLSPATAKYSKLDTVTSGTQNLRTADTRIVGGYITVSNNTSASTEGDVDFNYTFQTDFAYAPIVTATPILLGDASADAGKDTTVILTKVTTSGLEGIVRFNTTTDVSVGLNILAVGVPV